MGRKLDKFILLMWKNWLLQWRHPIQTLVEILAPVLFSALLVLVRSLVDPEKHATQYYTPFDNTLDVVFNKTNNTLHQIVWSPCNDELDKIMGDIADSLNLLDKCYDDSEKLEIYMKDPLSLLLTLAAVEFEDSLNDTKSLPKNMKVTLRFPGELRTAGIDALGRNIWWTNLLFPVYQMAGPRDTAQNEGARPGYSQEGFLALQEKISFALINYFKEQKTGSSSSIPTQVNMQRFPYPPWTNDPLLRALQSFVGLIVMLSFAYTCINTVKVITTEKERQLKESMKIMGLPNWLHWTAWFVKSFTFLLITVILMVILMKVSWYPGTNYSVFTLANSSVIFVFLMVYVCATITFCFAVSVFFSNANTASTIAGLTWFLSHAPYSFLRDKYDKLSLATKLASSLCSNTAMSYGFQLMLMFEGAGDGVQWHNVWKTTTPDDNLTLGLVTVMLIIDTVIYLLVALYVEAVFPGDYGVPHVWYFPFTPSYWCGRPRFVGVEDSPECVVEANEFFEKEPTHLHAGVVLKNLRKVYANKKVAVRDLSLNMYEGQITVLLGHNGAGKTTTMSMLTGMYPPTSGTAIVSGHDIRHDMKGVRASLGLCPQHNILFDELTVSEHIYFFSRLKGLDGDQIKAEIKKYVKLLELEPKADAKSSTLSGGMKRKLSVGVALCGDSKVVMFDEPTAGMDPSARRALWDLLQSQKKDRTMLLSTHFMDEADLLGDRIAIMAGGRLQCCGTSFFLKKRYGAGYHLIMDKSQTCDVHEVTNLLRKHIPNLQVENNIGSELTYDLNESQSSVFEEMLNDLEEHSQDLGVASYGISLTTLEEVFMKVGADHGQEELHDAKEMPDAHNDTEIPNGYAELDQHSLDSKVDISEHHFLTGVALWKNQFLAMIMKKILSILRTWILQLIQIIIPVCFLIVAVFVVRNTDPSRDLPRLKVSLDAYENPVTVINGDSVNKYYEHYVDILKYGGHNYIDVKTGDFSDYIIKETEAHTAIVRSQYIIGATFFKNQSVKAWFNNEPYHSPPLALEHVINAIVQQEVSPQHSIEFYNYPLPFTLNTKFTRLVQGNTMGFQLAFNIGFSMAFVSSFYIMFYVRERVSKAKHLQFVSGVEVVIFWASSFLIDMLMFTFTSLCLLITLAIFQEDGFNTFASLARVFSVLMYFGFSMLPMMYLASFLFDVPSTGYTRMTLINIFTGVAAFLVVQVLQSPDLDLEYIGDILNWIFLLIPHYSLSAGIRDLNFIYSRHHLCETMIDSCVHFEIPGLPHLTPEQCQKYVCRLQEQCCTLNTNYYGWEDHGIGRNIFFSTSVAIALLLLLLAIEYRAFENLKHQLNNALMPPPLPTATDDDEDVKHEKEKITNAPMEDIQNYSLVLKNVTKYYKKFLAVNNLCLGVNRFECFGLLGINGAGKTTTFKMMTGDEQISYGDAYVNGINLATNMKKVQKLIGYCPQFDALLDDLTGRETLVMFCLLRGIVYRECNYVAEKLAKDFDFSRHLNKKVKEYSGGNKRKLSTAVALIGNPLILYLDEPTTGMDPGTKRYLWNAICKVRDSGKCIVLTSHSMEECEALCTRLAIMVNGRFKCLGSTQHLKSKFSEGYTLSIKVRKYSEEQEIQPLELHPIETFVKSSFPSAIPRENHQELLTFYIPDMSVPWSKMFGIMERGKRLLNIEDYSLGQSSLEQVFLGFTKLQRTE